MGGDIQHFESGGVKQARGRIFTSIGSSLLRLPASQFRSHNLVYVVCDDREYGVDGILGCYVTATVVELDTSISESGNHQKLTLRTYSLSVPEEHLEII